MHTCRACHTSTVDVVVDLGAMPRADHFPSMNEPMTPAESGHGLEVGLCRACGLAQLVGHDAVTDEPYGVEPRAMRDQAAVAVDTASAYLSGDTVTEFLGPHGASWLPLLAAHGLRPVAAGKPASVVLDSFGIMHEPDQQAAFRTRAEAVGTEGVLLIQFHSLDAILRHRQWTSFRHGHFAYYSLTALQRLIARVGFHVLEAWTFDLLGGTVLIAARRAPAPPATPEVRRILAAEAKAGATEPDSLRALQHTADGETNALRDWLVSMARQHRQVFAYGAESRAVSLLARARVDHELITAVADASPAKQGRRMPGTDVPIVAPADLVAAAPDAVLLTMPELLPEVRAAHTELSGRWVLPPTGGIRHQHAGTIAAQIDPPFH